MKMEKILALLLNLYNILRPLPIKLEQVQVAWRFFLSRFFQAMGKNDDGKQALKLVLVT